MTEAPTAADMAIICPWLDLARVGVDVDASTTGGDAASPSHATGLLSHMGHDPVDVDSLCARAGMSAEQVASELLRLELEGRVAALPGGLYQRLEKRQPG